MDKEAAKTLAIVVSALALSLAIIAAQILGNNNTCHAIEQGELVKSSCVLYNYETGSSHNMFMLYCQGSIKPKPYSVNQLRLLYHGHVLFSLNVGEKTQRIEYRLGIYMVTGNRTQVQASIRLLGENHHLEIINYLSPGTRAINLGRLAAKPLLNTSSHSFLRLHVPGKESLYAVITTSKPCSLEMYLRGGENASIKIRQRLEANMTQPGLPGNMLIVPLRVGNTAPSYIGVVCPGSRIDLQLYKLDHLVLELGYSNGEYVREEIPFYPYAPMGAVLLYPP